jgi:hypothetical protein
VDSSGRRARLLRRAGILLGVVTIGYVAVLGLAFTGGISVSPSEILPFNSSQSAAEGGPGYAPPGGGPPPGAGETPPTALPTTLPTAPPPTAASAVPSASASATASTGGN